MRKVKTSVYFKLNCVFINLINTCFVSEAYYTCLSLVCSCCYAPLVQVQATAGKSTAGCRVANPLSADLSHS